MIFFGHEKSKALEIISVSAYKHFFRITLILILIRIGQLHETLEHTLRSCLVTYNVCGERVEGGGGPGWNSTWCRHHKWERSGGTTSLEQLQEQDGSSRWEPEGGSYENPIDEWNPWIWFWCWENSLDSRTMNTESLQEQTFKLMFGFPNHICKKMEE